MGIQMNEDRWCVVQVTINPSIVSANTTNEQAFALPGLRAGDFVQVIKPTNTTGLTVGNARASAADTLAIQFGNHTGSNVDAPAETYDVWVFRPEKKFSSVQL